MSDPTEPKYGTILSIFSEEQLSKFTPEQKIKLLEREIQHAMHVLKECNAEINALRHKINVLETEQKYKENR